VEVDGDTGTFLITSRCSSHCTKHQCI